jgi:hypothetical protein
MNRIQQLAGIKSIHENFNSPEVIKKDVMSLKDKPEELKKWVLKYVKAVSGGDFTKLEPLRVALNVIEKEGIKI